ncbi:MAG: biotin--[acetyl-CoA-carboxylase] ligase, partial [Flavobacteriales bacterium]|nr:biotin--[acetyl-CoA-carboxylase] ligase [Flavobacteriales bacterium]
MLTYKISATPSTNLYLKELIKNVSFQEEILVVTHNQTKGRGQMGNVWHSQNGKSLTFSVLKDVFKLEIHNQFYISMAVSLAIKMVLDSYKISDVKIKWPNDILSSNKK